jgi:cell division protein FtsQ
MASTGKIQDFRKINLIKEKASKKKEKVKAYYPKKKDTKVHKNNENKVSKKSVEGVSSVQQAGTRRKVRTKSHKGLVVFFMFLVIIGVGVGCLLTPTFNTNSVFAQDGINVTKEELLSKANIQIGINIFKINTWKIEDKILELPYVKEAKVSRKLPDTIVINIIEKEQYAQIKYLESFLIMDKHGSILELLNEKMDLPIIYGIELSDTAPGTMLNNEEKIKYDNIVLLLETMKKNNFEYIVDEINYEDFENIKLVIGDIDVDFGKIDKDINIKISYLQEVLKNVDGKKGKLDLSGEYLERTIFEEIL